MTPYDRNAENEDLRNLVHTENQEPANKRATSEEIYFLGLSPKEAKRIQTQQTEPDEEEGLTSELLEYLGETDLPQGLENWEIASDEGTCELWPQEPNHQHKNPARL